MESRSHSFKCLAAGPKLVWLTLSGIVKKKKKKMLTCSSKFNTDSLCAGFVVCVQRDTGKKKSIKRQKMISH